MRTQSIPCEKNKLPSGSTSHHLPLNFSVRKKPVAANFGPQLQPPYLSQLVNPGFSASSLASAVRLECSSVSDLTFPGQTLCRYWPKLSMKGRYGSASFVQAVGGW